MILVLTPVVVQLVFVALIYQTLTKAAASFEKVQRGKAAVLDLHKNEINFAQMILVLSDTAYTGNTEAYEHALSRMNVVFKNDKAWTDMDLRQYPELAPAIELFTRLQDQFNSLYKSGRKYAAQGPKALEAFANNIGLTAAFNLYMDQRTLARMIMEIERHQVATEPDELAYQKATVITIFSVMLLVGLLMSSSLAILFASDIVKRTEKIAENARRVAAGKPIVLTSSGTDEIAQLDSTIFNASLTLNEVRAREAVILDNAADVICSLDSRLKFITVGEASAKIWKYAPDELLGLSLLSILSSDSADRTRNAFSRMADGSSSMEGRVENQIRCGDGSLKDSVWAVNWSPEKKAFFCVVHDVTELRAVEKLKQHFLSVASHDVRAPLSAVSLNVSTLLDQPNSEISDSAKKQLTRVQESVSRLTSLVGELLELDKLEAGKLTLDLCPVSASDVCEAAKELLYGMALKADVTINGPTGEALILADEKRMVQLISNLLSNAIKFSPPNTSVKLAIVKDGDFADIRVSDQGPGIAADEQSLIFDKFRQSRTASGVAHKGTGLGLAIVRALTESHGGSVGIESEVGKGSTFFVRIPLVLNSDEEGP